ncbi:MAG: TonB-dependent receptor [Caulobacteraceae bacterium]
MSKLGGRLGLVMTTCLAAGAIVGGSAAHAQAGADPGSTSPANGQTINLSPVKVQGTTGSDGTPPAASSTVSRAQLQQIPPTEPTDILAGIPGVFSQYDGTPGLAISVRGMQDFGRVNVMIDGARQDFQESGHAANGTVYVDPALLGGVDVTRGTTSTADGAGAIGGVVNLRTIGIDDVLAPNWRYGFTTTDMYGTNHYDGSGMVAAGARVNDRIDVVGAFSLRNSGNYEDGDGDVQPGTYQRLRSGLIKTDIVTGADQTLQLGAIFYSNDFANGSEGIISKDSVDSTTVTAKYHWAPSGNSLVDFHINGFYAGTRLSEDTPSFQAVTTAPANTTHYHLTTLGIDADNISRFPLGPVSTTLDYGGEYYHDKVTTTDLTGDTGETPSGGRGLGGLFVQADLAWRIFQLTGGLRYDTYSLDGSGVNQTGGFTNAPVGAFDIHKSSSAVSPKVTFAATPLKGLQVYSSYGLGFRPPATTETLFSGAHPGLDFLRFIPNPDLAPERTHGWEVGAKLDYHNVLRANDAFSLQGDVFDTQIRDYIAQTLVVGAPDPASPIPIPLEGFFYQNMPGTTKTEGFELQGSYDAKIVFANLSYANIRTKLPAPDYTGFDQILTTPPRSVLAATVGVRLFSDRLTLGERTRAASATQGQLSADTGIATAVPSYVVEDVFGSYQITPALKAFASVDNIGDKQYLTDALASAASPGLTAKFGFTLALGR